MHKTILLSVDASKKFLKGSVYNSMHNNVDLFHRRFKQILQISQTLLIQSVSEVMQKLCFKFLVIDICLRLTTLFCSFGKMEQIWRRYPNGESNIPLLFQCSLAQIVYIFLSITHLMSSPFWQRQVKFTFTIVLLYRTSCVYLQLNHCHPHIQYSANSTLACEILLN